MTRRVLIAGNWKMNMLRAEGEALASALAKDFAVGAGADMLVCPPATLIAPVAAVLNGGAISVGGQDCHMNESGAHTGDVAAAMIKDLGGSHVIVGHSERRADHGESDATVKAKAEAALAAGLVPIVCVGETEAERDAGKAEAVVEAQIRGSLPAGATETGVVIAYEPVWAIGTGRTPTIDDIAAMHAHMRKVAGSMLGSAGALLLLYGGSVKPGNAAEILALEDVDGALVGGASLKAEDFLAIAAAA
ncbi:triose-phosphate isomerase [Nisaea acidiphila]|uniref:Triosephosphate isomerase n=1 Tax=Nisaea acidiphila TaxID=1862145 RepID=A0A9J7ATP7_9PROT|nr:triose-phosphate isomerase [Nisaea acidiphila]UUX50210.1 triose-phosphate isomerase [Nisaea acidiphila]